MRHSSCVVLVLALVMLASAYVLTTYAPEQSAPPMSPAVARALLKRGQEAFERRDTGALMELFAADTRIDGRRRNLLQDAVAEMLREVGPGPLHVEWSEPTLHREGPRQTISTTVAVTQKTPRADIVYFRTRLTLDVERRWAPRWLGMLQTQEWRITRLSSDPPIGLPDY